MKMFTKKMESTQSKRNAYFFLFAIKESEYKSNFDVNLKVSMRFMEIKNHRNCIFDTQLGKPTKSRTIKR